MKLSRAAFLLAFLAACQTTPPTATGPSIPPGDQSHAPEPYVKVRHPEWTKDAVIYQINTRQFTPEGTFAAAQEQLPRLKELGVDILWLMPIHPIGEVNRKGSLGSPYSVRDYKAVNPEFGTMEDFRAFVHSAHQHGFRVILDWVANHTAWDNPIATTNPEWYERDWRGAFHPTPWTDWTDIIDLDFDEPALRAYMAEAMLFWVRDVGIDGFRCDVAGLVPLDFWEDIRRKLDEIRPVFLLAEWEERDLHARAFNATYAWSWKDAARDIAQGRSDATRMTGFLQHHLTAWPEGAMRMFYTENHDQNAWEGTPQEFYGDALATFMTLQFLMDGIPLIHNGQEAGNNRRLAFFERDPIIWTDHRNHNLIRLLTDLKSQNPALWNGHWGGPYIPVMTNRPAAIVSFARKSGENEILALFNLSDEPASFSISDGPVEGLWTNAFSGEPEQIVFGNQIELVGWDFLVLHRNPLKDGRDGHAG